MGGNCWGEWKAPISAAGRLHLRMSKKVSLLVLESSDSLLLVARTCTAWKSQEITPENGGRLEILLVCCVGDQIQGTMPARHALYH